MTYRDDPKETVTEVAKRRGQEKALCQLCKFFGGGEHRCDEGDSCFVRPACHHPHYLKPASELPASCREHNSDGTCPFYNPGLWHRFLQLLRIRPKARL